VLTRESFKPYALLKRERVEIPELNDFVYVRELSAGEALEFREKISDGQKFESLVLPMLAKVIVDEKGQQIFNPSDTDLIGKSFPLHVMEAIAAKAQQLSGLGVTPEKN
jgi:hypothetical protein